MSQWEMQTVIYIHFTDLVVNGKAVVITVSFQFYLIKCYVLIIKLGNIGIYIQQVLVTVYTSVYIGIIKSPVIFCEQIKVWIHLPRGNDEAEFFPAQFDGIGFDITRIVTVQELLKAAGNFLMENSPTIAASNSLLITVIVLLLSIIFDSTTSESKDMRCPFL